MTIVLQGIGVGILLALIVGPSFFYLIRVGMTKGFVPALNFAIGIMLSDLALLAVIIKGFSQLFENELFQQIFSLVAGVLIVVLGINALLNKARLKQTQFDNASHSNWWYVFKGFGINVLNPFTFMLWVAVIGAIELRNDFTTLEYNVFVASLLVTVLSLDACKAYLANYLGRVMNENSLTRINKVLGVIFLILGTRLLIHFYQLLNHTANQPNFEVIKNAIGG